MSLKETIIYIVTNFKYALDTFLICKCKIMLLNVFVTIIITYSNQRNTCASQIFVSLLMVTNINI